VALGCGPDITCSASRGAKGNGTGSSGPRADPKVNVAPVAARRRKETKNGEKRPAMYHVIANSYIEFVDKDRARLEAVAQQVA
jgi:hypothetical protein